MRMYDLIQKKKEGLALTKEEIAFFVGGVTDGSIPDYQTSALLMAICLRGMDGEETAALTFEMMQSGDVVDLSVLGEGTVDKHSTGGVGDKTTLIVAPLAAACGATVAKMSGRGLGFTGGTVDKMESVPGMRVSLSSEEFFRIAKSARICVVGQSGSLAPADKKLYALRDVTATIDSVPLIASSILSKKLASGAKNIVLDVKYGSGAFMKTPEEAKLLAEEMVRIGTALGRRVCAFITDMDEPLGYAVGNAGEVKEAVEVLSGRGEARLTELCLALASRMVSLSLSIPAEEAASRVAEALSSGAGLRAMEGWITAQGGDFSAVLQKDFAKAPCEEALLAPQSGILSSIDALGVGRASCLLGAGREKKEDAIDPLAGVYLKKRRGDSVKKGEPIALLSCSDPTRLPAARELLLSSLRISSDPVPLRPTVYAIVE